MVLENNAWTFANIITCNIIAKTVFPPQNQPRAQLHSTGADDDDDGDEDNMWICEYASENVCMGKVSANSRIRWLAYTIRTVQSLFASYTNKNARTPQRHAHVPSTDKLLLAFFRRKYTAIFAGFTNSFAVPKRLVYVCVVGYMLWTQEKSAIAKPFDSPTWNDNHNLFVIKLKLLLFALIWGIKFCKFSTSTVYQALIWWRAFAHSSGAIGDAPSNLPGIVIARILTTYNIVAGWWRRACGPQCCRMFHPSPEGVMKSKLNKIGL